MPKREPKKDALPMRANPWTLADIHGLRGRLIVTADFGGAEKPLTQLWFHDENNNNIYLLSEDFKS